MMTKKDREIANQKAKILNRDKLITSLSDKRHSLQIENKMLKELFSKVYYLATSNTYGNDKAILGKIREVIASPNTNNF